MIAALKGVVFRKDATKILFDVNNVIYEIFMPLDAIEKVKEKDTIIITHIIREDASLLFGFLEVAQKNLFDSLIKINGIGPKVALAICNYFSPNELLSIIANNDYISLKKIPGIGEKNAKRIIVELKIDDTIENNIDNTKQEALSALETLGFKRSEVIKLLEKSSAKTTQGIIKDVLKYIKK